MPLYFFVFPPLHDTGVPLSETQELYCIPQRAVMMGKRTEKPVDLRCPGTVSTEETADSGAEVEESEERSVWEVFCEHYGHFADNTYQEAKVCTYLFRMILMCLFLVFLLPSAYHYMHTTYTNLIPSDLLFYSQYERINELRTYRWSTIRRWSETSNRAFPPKRCKCCSSSRPWGCCR